MRGQNHDSQQGAEGLSRRVDEVIASMSYPKPPDSRCFFLQRLRGNVTTNLSMESRTSGYEVVHAAQAATKRPAMVVSGFPELLDQWRTEGTDAALQKPTDVPELLATINRLAGR